MKLNDTRATARVDQILVGASPYDAITNMALRIRDSLQAVVESRIFATYIHPEMEGVFPVGDLPRGSGSNSVVIFHASYGDPSTFLAVKGFTGPVVLVFHNFSPSEFFEETDPMRAAMLAWGWRELEILRDHFAVVVADSDFNRRELASRGFEDVHVIAAGVDPWRLARIEPDSRIVGRSGISDDEFVVLFSGQALGHKNIEVLVHSALLLRLRGRPVRLVIAGSPTDPVVFESLERTVVDLGIENVSIIGTVSDEELAALFGRADLLATASMHEGLCLPILEAMALEVPVLARAVAAIPDTCGGAAWLLDESAGSFDFANAIGALMDDDEARSLLVAEGRRNLVRFDLSAQLAQFVEVISEVVTCD